MANDPLPDLLESPHPRKAERRTVLPLFLFVFTCISTFWVGATAWKPIFFMDGMKTAGEAVCENWRQGLAYMAAVMVILATHEMGHFLVARRYRIPTSFPYFLPMPISPLGTFGAVIAMQSAGETGAKSLTSGLPDRWPAWPSPFRSCGSECNGPARHFPAPSIFPSVRRGSPICWRCWERPMAPSSLRGRTFPTRSLRPDG